VTHLKDLRMKIAAKMLATLLSLLLLVTPVLAADVNLCVAASLKEVLDELSNRFVQRHPGLKLFKNYGASGALSKQIESGAPSDVFISANLEWMDYLKHKKPPVSG
jgi:molybdate transport system substrate-binding protein